MPTETNTDPTAGTIADLSPGMHGPNSETDIVNLSQFHAIEISLDQTIDLKKMEDFGANKQFYTQGLCDINSVLPCSHRLGLYLCTEYFLVDQPKIVVVDLMY